MSFSAPTFLLGLALCALPVLIHFLHRRRRRVVPWALIELLARAQQEQPRSERLSDRLLLLIRTLALACLVLAFARPILHLERDGFASSACPERTVMLIDASASTTRAAGGATLFERGQRAALAQLDEHPFGSFDVHLVGRRAVRLGDTRVDSRAQLREAIRAAAPAPEPAELLAALAELEATGALADAQRVLLVTDLQAESLTANTPRVTRALEAIGARMPITLLSSGDAPALDNVTVSALECVQGALIDLEVPARFRLELRNRGAARSARVVVRVDGAPLRAVELELAADGVAQDVFPLSFDAPGVHVVEAALEPDGFPFDDQRALCVEAPVGVPVLCLVDDARAEHADEPTRFLRAFLSPDTSPQAALFDARLASWSTLEELPPAAPALLVVSDATRLDAARVAVLEQRVAAGNGLVIFLGPGTDRALYEAELTRGGDGLLPLPLLSAEGVAFDEVESFDATLALDLPAAVHPAFATHGSAQRWRAALGSLHLSKRFRLDEAADPRAQVAARLDDGTPLVVEKPFGRGRVALVTTASDLRWSNLPTSPAMALLDRLARHLIAPQLDVRNARVGDELAYRVASADPAQGGRWRLPDGEERAADWDAARDVLTLDRAPAPGVYELTTADGAGARFAARFDASESRFAQATLEELARRHPGVPFELADEPRATPRRVLPLWTAFLLLALVLLLMESWIAARGASRPMLEPRSAR